MEIIEFKQEYKQDFINLNIEWIKEFFVPEGADYEILNHVEGLIRTESMIYFAIEDSKVLATCMVMPLGNNIWEICKLAASGQYTGKGAGSAVFKACMDYAILHKAVKIKLISNRILKPALHIYDKFGFKEVSLDKAYWGFSRADIELEYIV